MNYKEDIQTIIRLNKQGMNQKEIADHFNTCYQNVQACLKSQGIKLKKWPVNKEINHNFFSEIDTELKAYLLGFFIADGCIYDSFRIGLCLSEKRQVYNRLI